MSTMPNQDHLRPAWLDMSRYPNLDPELAVAIPVLQALRDILHTSDLALLPPSTWVGLLREVLGRAERPDPASSHGTTSLTGTTGMPGAIPMPDTPTGPGIMEPLWNHAPGPVVPEELDHGLYDAPEDGAGHDLAWYLDPPEVGQPTVAMEVVHPDHPGPGPEHVV